MKTTKVTVEALLEACLAQLQAAKLPVAARTLLESEKLGAVKSLINRRVTPKLLGKMVALGLSDSKTLGEHQEVTTE